MNAPGADLQDVLGRFLSPPRLTHVAPGVSLQFDDSHSV